MTALVKPSNIMSYHNIQESEPQVTQPEFGRIIGSLREAVAFTIEMAKSTAIHCNALKPMVDDVTKDNPPAQYIGVTGALWEQIDLLERANSIARGNYYHLKETVGT